MWACRLLRDSNSDLGVAGAGALGMRLHGKGEHEAVTGLRVGGCGERGVRRAFLPQRQVLGACIVRWPYGDIPMRVEALAVGVDDGRRKGNALAGAALRSAMTSATCAGCEQAAGSWAHHCARAAKSS